MSSVAVIGVTSVVGAPLLEALQSNLFAGKFQYPIKAFSRSNEGKTSTDKVKYLSADYADTDLLVKELQNTDVIISLVAVGPEILNQLEKIVKQVKPKLYIPSQYGVEIKKVQQYLPGFLDVKAKHTEAVRAAGIKTVDVYTGFFALPKTWLYEIVPHFGIDTQKNEYVVRGDLDAPITFTQLKDLGLSIAVIAAEPTKDWPHIVKIESGKVTTRQVIDRYEKDHNVKLTKKQEFSKEDTLKEAVEKLKNFSWADFVFYLHTIGSQGQGKGVSFDDNDDELVNPGEKLWKWTGY